MRTFSLDAPLPQGTVVLEASAGTGKTYAIAGLAARFIAEGRARVDDVLLVTFSRAATAELRTRVRQRLKESASVLSTWTPGDPRPADTIDAVLVDADADEVAERAARLRRALSDFDRATIMTTHEFCHGMTRGLGVLAAQEPQSVLVEDVRPLADEVSADLYVQRYAHGASRPPFPYLDDTFRQPSELGARTLARDAVEASGELVPSEAPGVAGERVAFARGVRHEVERRKQMRRLHSFDDMLVRLRDALHHPISGPAARARLAQRFPVVLIDEFQDTDPVQWQIIRAAFTGEGSTLVLIGDHKQAIYAFRGADVHTYSAAVRSAGDAVWTLTVNYRADAPVVDAVAAMIGGIQLGDEIGVPPVQAKRQAASLTAPAGSPWAAGAQLRVLDDGDDRTHPSAAHAAIERDLVAAVAELLAPDSPVRLEGRPVEARDIAVLVRSNWRGQQLARALQTAGIPTTFSGTSSVFSTSAAQDWLTLLRTLDQLRRSDVQRAVLTDFVGGTVEQLASASDDRRTTWSIHLHTWRRALNRGGVPLMMSSIERDTAFTPRLLSLPDGERRVTDHRHLAELLHERAARHGGSARGLAEWLAAEMAAQASTTTERTRRIETDALAVLVMTFHRAKGLQFGIVALPEAGHAPGSSGEDDTGRRLVLPSEDGRLVDVGGRGSPGRRDRWSDFLTDNADEELRALYVALTRAQAHVVLWWSRHRTTAASPLHRLLSTPRTDPRGRPPRAPSTAVSPLTLDWLADAGIAVTPVDATAPTTPVPAPRPSRPLASRLWTRTIDPHWRRTSYSGLTALAHHEEAVASALDGDVVSDEPDTTLEVVPDPRLTAASAWASLPGGVAFGSLVHAVFEAVDARGSDWETHLTAAVHDALQQWPVPGVAVDALVQSLGQSFTTPLGPLAEGTTLRSFGAGNRLSELDFEFGLSNPAATLADVAALLRRHTPASALLAGYADRLDVATLTTQRLHGFLTGSIDAVLRLPSQAHLVVDYKTNRLSAPEEPLTLGHYTPVAMAEAMMASHYPLQALLYSVALHRFLRLRRPDYDPDRHLGGALYLFVRGMAGPSTPLVGADPVGVFSWRPSTGLVLDTSRLLAGERS